MPRWSALPREIRERFPAPPERSSFASEDEYEEAVGYWQSHVGRNIGFAMAQWRETPRRLWYRGAPHNDGLVFAEPERAAYIASLHSALKNSRTWGQFRAALPAEEYRRIVTIGFVDVGEDMPEDSEPFNPEAVPGWSDGEYPPWLQLEVQEVLPKEIIEAFGRETLTAVNGSYVHIPSSCKDEVCAALKARGFELERRSELFW